MVKRRVITVEDLPGSGELLVPFDTVVTPLAREEAARRGITIREVRTSEAVQRPPSGRVVALGSDHAGFPLKEQLKPLLERLRYSVLDMGTHEEKPADYPDIAVAVGGVVARGEADCGIIVDGAGIGSCMAANKVPGVRAALCYDKASARNSREHNHANVLTLGARLIPPELAAEIVVLWLATPFAGGRHAARVDKINALDRKRS